MGTIKLSQVVAVTRDVTDCNFEHPASMGPHGKPRRGSNRESHARHVAIYVARVLTNRSLPELARDFGFTCHTSVLYAIRHVADEDPRLLDLALEVIARVRGVGAL